MLILLLLGKIAWTNLIRSTKIVQICANIFFKFFVAIFGSNQTVFIKKNTYHALLHKCREKSCLHEQMYYASPWVSRVLKYPKKCLEDLTTFSCLLDEDIPKIWKKLNSDDGFWATCKIAQPIQPVWQHIFALP